MKRSALAVAALLLIATSTAALRAQVPPPPTPTPDPHSYRDAGMNFTAPADAYLMGRRPGARPDQLGNNLRPIAVWAVHPGKEDMRIIQLSMEAFSGAPDQWEGQFESQTHDAQEGTLIRKKASMSLLNGMPASFVEVTYGTGFAAKKEYAVVWADGSRGVVLSYTARIGDVTAKEVKSELQNVTAVRYPIGQP